MINGVLSYFLTFVSLLVFGPPMTAPTIDVAPPLANEATAPAIDADALASCLTERGAKLYGAYWCSHCAAEKELFGEAISKVNFIECDASGPNGNPQACIAAGIEAYPTWKMPGKADKVGAQGFQALATWSGCPTN